MFRLRRSSGWPPPYTLVAWLPYRLIEVRVKCKRDLNASRALLILERTILKMEGRPLIEFGSVDSVQTGSRQP